MGSLWNEEYSCTPYIEPKTGLHYIMQYARCTQPVLILGVFDELIVVRYNEGRKTYAGLVYEEAVSRRHASFFEIPALGAVMTSATDADAPEE